jgi:AcrR family transcriptional regulator
VNKIEQARARAARRRRPRALSLEAIIDTALHIVDREGVSEVSMRRVAAEFDTGPASLYAYVANKDELLRHVHDRVVDEVEVPSTGDWQSVVKGWAFNTRDVYARHNDVALLSFAHIPSGEHMVEITERLLKVMLDAGLPPKVATWALDVVSQYVTADAYEGFLMSRRFDDGSGRDPEEVGMEYFQGVADYFASLPPERYPYLTGNVETMMTGGSDERFEFGVDMLIAGLAAQVTKQRRDR